MGVLVRMVQPKRKGSQFELLIYKDLVNYGECKRTIGSGSSTEPGDILFKTYAIECKHLKQVRWVNLTKFWNKLNKEVDDYHKIGLNLKKPIIDTAIIFRQNREPIMVMCRMKYKDKTTRGILSYNIWKQIIKWKVLKDL